MRSRTLWLTAVFVLAAVVGAAAEVALDEVVQAGRFVLYRDHADPHKYYYVPDAPRLATKRDGTPEFTFIKYSKTDGATKGGIIHFLVTWGMSEGELSTAESALRLKDPQAKIAGPVPFKEGTFKVVSATAGEGGLFSRKIVGEGKAPIMPGQKAAVSIALTEEGASLLWESFKNPTSDISVMFALKFAGVTPAFQAKLKVNWDKVYTQHDIKLHAEGTIKVVKLQADVRAILESLRQQGAIQLDVVGENESMQKMLDAVYGHLITLMCDKVPMGPGEATSPATKRPAPAPGGDWPDLHPAWSMAVLGDVVRAADERLRGGPFWDQEQAQATRAETPCDPASTARWTSLVQQGMALESQEDYFAAAKRYEEASVACPKPVTQLRIAACYDKLQDFEAALDHYGRFIREAGDDLTEQKNQAAGRIGMITTYSNFMKLGRDAHQQGDLDSALRWFESALNISEGYEALYHAAGVQEHLGDRSGDASLLETARERFSRIIWGVTQKPYLNNNQVVEGLRYLSGDNIERINGKIEKLRGAAPPVKPEGQAGAIETARAQQTVAQTGTTRAQTEAATAEERRVRREAAQAEQTGGGAQTQTVKPPDTVGGGDKPPGTQAAATSSSGTKPPGTVDAGTKPPTGGELSVAQIEQQLASGQGTKPPDTTGGTKPPSGQTPAAKTQPQAPGNKTAPQAPEVKPIVSVQVGYSFKRVKMSGNYEVDMRKRLREDRDIVMSGNIGGIYQKYGEDKRFFSVVSLDDPTFQERSVEVILDGQDASDFKSYINAVSVLFRKQRFSGAPMTGEIKFVDQQFAQSGNRQSFKYGRLNEASTEWLDYEYKPKWSLYGGVEWEGDWTKTSDSVLTLSPPVRRRTLEISVDEDNILKNSVKALAVQVKHTLYGKEILKEVVINYDKGDPLQAVYTYMHEDGNLGYSYKVVWLFLDGREIHTDWTAKESPFIYAVYTKK